MTMLPEVEHSLLAAAQRRHELTADTATPSPGAMRRLWRTRRALVLACGSLLIAVPAVAATQPWQPLLGDPSVDGSSPTVSADRVPAPQLQALGVLRREQTEQDRGAETRQLLSSLAPVTDGVRLQAVRLLHAESGQSVALVPVARLYRRMPAAGGRIVGRDGLCLTNTLNGGLSVVCGTTRELNAGGIAGTSGVFTYGLVPDGVASVRFAFTNGPTIDLAVRDNFYGEDLPAAPARIDQRPVTLGLQRNPSPASSTAARPVTVTWLDADGGAVPLQSSR
jgi:hypothetical protein